MAERIMEIILYVISSIRDTKVFSESNIKELENLGYTKSEISTAFSWLAEKAEAIDEPEISAYTATAKGFRILHAAEIDLFTKESYGELIQLITLGLINNQQLELLLERAIMAGSQVIDSRLLKNYTAALHFESFNTKNVPGRMFLIGNETIN